MNYEDYLIIKEVDEESSKTMRIIKRIMQNINLL